MTKERVDNFNKTLESEFFKAALKCANLKCYDEFLIAEQKFKFFIIFNDVLTFVVRRSLKRAQIVRITRKRFIELEQLLQDATEGFNPREKAKITKIARLCFLKLVIASEYMSSGLSSHFWKVLKKSFKTI